MNLFEVRQSSFHFSLCLPHYASLLCLIFIQFRELLGMLPCTLINYHNDVRPDEVIFFSLSVVPLSHLRAFEVSLVFFCSFFFLVG